MKVSAYSWGLGIWVSSTSFQKCNKGWPQQPPTEKVLIFNMSFHDSVNLFSKHQNKCFKSSNYWFQELGWLSSDFSGLTNLCSFIDLSSLCSLAGLYSPISSKKTSCSWRFDHHWHQNYHYWSFFVDWIIKNPIYY